MTSYNAALVKHCLTLCGQSGTASLGRLNVEGSYSASFEAKLADTKTHFFMKTTKRLNLVKESLK